QAALEHDSAERDEVMGRFRKKVDRLVQALATVPGVRVLPPAGAVYALPHLSAVFADLGITSPRLAVVLPQGVAEPQRRGLRGRGVLRAGRPGLLALQLCGAGRPAGGGGGVPARGGGAEGAGGAVFTRPPPLPSGLSKISPRFHWSSPPGCVGYLLSAP